jgi:hypothetical protein
MPTGYTAQLEEMKYNTEKWLIQSISRAFGMCVMLRDDRQDLSEEEIIKKIKDDSDSVYHTKELANATKELQTLEKKDIFESGCRSPK